MNAKTLLTIGLLVFVAAGVGVAIYKQAGSGSPAGPNSPEAGATSGQTPEVSDPSPNAGQPETAQGKRVIAYYFHGNARCPTCMNMERYAHEAVETGFPDQLGKGQLKWKVVNYEEPANEHFVTDFGLVAPILVLVLMDGDRQVKWEERPEIWELAGDKPAFIEFVQKHVDALLDECGESA